MATCAGQTIGVVPTAEPGRGTGAALSTGRLVVRCLRYRSGRLEGVGLVPVAVQVLRSSLTREGVDRLFPHLAGVVGDPLEMTRHEQRVRNSGRVVGLRTQFS